MAALMVGWVVARVLASGRLRVDHWGLAWRTAAFQWTVLWQPPTAAAAIGIGVVLVLLGSLRWLKRCPPPVRAVASALAWGAVSCLAVGHATSWAVPRAGDGALVVAVWVLAVALFDRWGLRLPWGWWARLVPWALAATMPLVAWWGIFNGEVINADAVSQIGQARLLLNGRLTHEMPQHLRDVVLIVYATPTVPSFSQYPPGHILLVAASMLAGLPPQAVNIAGGAVLVVLTAALSRRVHGGSGVAAGALMATSPFYLVIAGEGMNHMTSAACLAGVAWCLLPRMAGPLAAPSPRAAAMAGVLLAWSGITRPLPTIAQGAVWLAVWLWVFWRAADQRPRLWHAMAAMMAGAAGPVLLAVAYNLATSGHPLKFGYQVNSVEMHVLGFRSDGPYPYSIANALDNLAATMLSAWWQVGGWLVGSWVLAVAAWRRWRGRLGPSMLLALCGSQLFAFFFYHYFDLFLGPRFQFETLAFACVLLAAPVEAALRRPAARSLVAVAFTVLCLQGARSGLAYYDAKFAANVASARRVRAEVDAHAHGPGPLVIVAPLPIAELAGRWFPARAGERPLWVVPVGKIDAARAVPEFADAQWVVVE